MSIEDCLQQEVEIAKDDVIRAAYLTVATCPRFPTELKRALERLGRARQLLAAEQKEIT